MRTDGFSTQTTIYAKTVPYNDVIMSGNNNRSRFGERINFTDVLKSNDARKMPRDAYRRLSRTVVLCPAAPRSFAPYLSRRTWMTTLTSQGSLHVWQSRCSWNGGGVLTYWNRDKITALCRHFHFHFLERKVLSPYSNSTEGCPRKSTWQYVSINLGNGFILLSLHLSYVLIFQYKPIQLSKHTIVSI